MSLSGTGRRWFPRGRGEFVDEAVAFVARQVGGDAGELGFYDWSGRTIEYHRAQIRASGVPGVLRGSAGMPVHERVSRRVVAFASG